MGEKFLPLLPGLLISLASLALAVDAHRRSRRRESDEDLQKRVDAAVRDSLSSLVSRVVTMETKVEIFWKGVSYSSSQALHSPHTPELDALIESFQDGSIDDGGLARFREMLKCLAEDEGETAFRRKMARDVLTLIHIRYEVAAHNGAAGAAKADETTKSDE